MQAKNTEMPKDLVSLLEQNLKEGRPLLQDAVLFRGTRLPDQTAGSYSSATMHGSLLPQVAASYTHNWKEETAFIGAYRIDRESTRFYQDFGLEQHLDGKKAPSMSVKDAEKLLEPFVREVVTAGDGRGRGRAEERLEAAIKRNLYEANIPTRTSQNTPNRPVDLFIYRGRPDVAIRRAVTMQMTKVGADNTSQAKAVMYKEHRNPAINRMHQLEQHAAGQPGPAFDALRNLKMVAQRDFGDQIRSTHGDKPLNAMLDAVAKEPLSVDQDRLGRFAKALVEGIAHPDAAVSGKAQAVMSELAKLDGSKATLQDVAKASSAGALSSTKSAETSVSKDLSTQEQATARTAKSPSALER